MQVQSGRWRVPRADLLALGWAGGPGGDVNITKAFARALPLGAASGGAAGRQALNPDQAPGLPRQPATSGPACAPAPPGAPAGAAAPAPGLSAGFSNLG